MPDVLRALLIVVCLSGAVGVARASTVSPDASDEVQVSARGPGAAQPTPETRVITGLVEDTLGGAIAEATVRATCGAVTREVRTDGAGRFVIDGLPAGG